MKSTVKGIVYFMGIFAVLAGLFGCNRREPEPEPPFEDGLIGKEGLGDQAVTNESGISYFCYSYNCSMAGDSYSYEVRYGRSEEELEEEGEETSPEDPEKLYFVYSSMLYGDQEMKLEIPETFLTSLGELYGKHAICRWDGFSMTDTNVCDGDGFSLDISFRDGASMSAGGSNAFPQGYLDFTSEMKALFQPFEEEVLKDAGEPMYY